MAEVEGNRVHDDDAYAGVLLEEASQCANGGEQLVYVVHTERSLTFTYKMAFIGANEISFLLDGKEHMVLDLFRQECPTTGEMRGNKAIRTTTGSPAMPPGSGGATNTPYVKPIPMTATSPMTTNSNGRAPPRDWMSSRKIETVPVMKPPHSNGTPKRRYRATAPPMTSAMSVAIATSSACSQYARRAHGWRMRVPRVSGRLCPVTMPSFAERYWMSQAMTLASTTTHTSR